MSKILRTFIFREFFGQFVTAKIGSLATKEGILKNLKSKIHKFDDKVRTTSLNDKNDLRVVFIMIMYKEFEYYESHC
mgnify:CR=1 FL=1